MNRALEEIDTDSGARYQALLARAERPGVGGFERADWHRDLISDG
jgi:hypothetical protein